MIALAVGGRTLKADDVRVLQLVLDVCAVGTRSPDDELKGGGADEGAER